MPITLSPVAGDGINAPAIRCNVNLPDSGTSVAVQGVYVAPSIGQTQPGGQQAPISFSGTVTSPGVPGSGTNYWITELNTTTGVIQTKASTTAIPTADAGNIVLFSQSIGVGAPSAVSQQGSFSFPWLGTVSPN